MFFGATYMMTTPLLPPSLTRLISLLAASRATLAFPLHEGTVPIFGLAPGSFGVNRLQNPELFCGVFLLPSLGSAIIFSAWSVAASTSLPRRKLLALAKTPMGGSGLWDEGWLTPTKERPAVAGGAEGGVQFGGGRPKNISGVLGPASRVIGTGGVIG